ncbi:MAG: ATP-binding protein [Bacteroidales bacterium]|nr:ATP-binding protein [Bacteroidales bacterium]
MIELLKELILDAQKGSIEVGFTRNLKVWPVTKKATVIVGVRRCGKSTYLSQIVNHLLNDGVKKENILFINFFDDRLAPLKTSGLDKVTEAYFLLYPEKKGNEKIYCFFDEIQIAAEWESFIDRLLRTENCEIYLSGSSARLLSKEIGTQMRGRAISWEMFPFSFGEYLQSQGFSYTLPVNTAERIQIQKSFEDYFNRGGFPETMGLEDFLRVKIHQEYFGSILFRDLIERYDVSHPKALTDLARKLLDNIASLYTLNNLTNSLQSLGHKAPKNTIAQFLEWFEDAYFLFTVRMYSTSFNKSNVNPKKIYCIDHAFVRSLTSGILVNSGHYLENVVFMALRRVYPEIFYYKTEAGQEIDFLILDTKRQFNLVQVAFSLEQPTTRQRELIGLQNAMKELQVENSTIVTWSESETIQAEDSKIEIIPAWRFLLQLEQTN